MQGDIVSKEIKGGWGLEVKRSVQVKEALWGLGELLLVYFNKYSRSTERKLTLAQNVESMVDSISPSHGRQLTWKRIQDGTLPMAIVCVDIMVKPLLAAWLISWVQFLHV